MSFAAKIFTLLVGGAGFACFLVGLGLFFFPGLVRWLDQALKKVLWDEDKIYRHPRLAGLSFIIISVIIYWLLYFARVYRFWQ